MNDEDIIKKIKKSKGKLILRETYSEEKPKSNIILHLKYTIKEVEDYMNEKNKIIKNPLDYDPVVPTELMTYSDTNPLSHSNYAVFSGGNGITEAVPNNTMAYTNVCNTCRICKTEQDPENVIVAPVIPLLPNSQIKSKLKELKNILFTQSVETKKKCACFWCSYDFDNEPYFIPRYYKNVNTKKNYYVYGVFCSAECAAAYLFNEKIDDSIKYERYQLLNKIYGNHSNGEIANTTENINPASNPHYLLEKYMGNLTIEEYRNLKTNRNNLFFIEKPYSRILPELYSETETNTSYKIQMADGIPKRAIGVK